jgi:hypothetical protein
MDGAMPALLVSYCLLAISILWETGATLVNGTPYIAVGPFILSILTSMLALYATHSIVKIHKTDARLNPYQNKFFELFKRLKPIFY